MQLHSHDDFTPLREIIVGSAENYLSHDRDVTFELFHHESLTGFRSDWAYPRLTAVDGDRAVRSWSIKRRYTEQLHEDVENLAATLAALGVTVHRPLLLPPNVAPIAGLGWQAAPTPALNIRDNTLILGNEIIETPPAIRSRYLETRLMAPIFRCYYEAGARWTTMPRPLLTDLSFDLSYVRDAATTLGGPTEPIADPTRAWFSPAPTSTSTSCRSARTPSWSTPTAPACSRHLTPRALPPFPCGTGTGACSAAVSTASPSTPTAPVPVRTTCRDHKALGETMNRTDDNTSRLGSFIVVDPDRQRVDRDVDHLLAPRPITADCFPTPALILRANDPASQRDMRKFAHKQAEAARSLHQMLTDDLRQSRSIDARAAAFTTAFSAAEDWRYRIAAAIPHPTGRYSAGHAERFRTPITDDTPNLFRIGEPERFRDGAGWNPITRTYVGGTETPASRTMRRFAALASARLADSPNVDVMSNRVTLADGRVVRGTRLLRGEAAHRAATEIAARIAARGGDTSRIITDGDLIYLASAADSDRKAIFHSAMTLLAQNHATSATALTAWLEAAYLLYQAPRRKRGGDATIRTFLIAAGTSLLDYPPVLLHDLDLRGYVRPVEQFVVELRAAQHTASEVHAPAASLHDNLELRLRPGVGRARAASGRRSPAPRQCFPADAAPNG